MRRGRGGEEDIIRKASYGSSCPLLLFPFVIFPFLRGVPEIGSVGREGGGDGSRREDFLFSFGGFGVGWRGGRRIK